MVVGQGTQFITGPCTSDADCASGCCGFNSGKCAGPIIAQERDGGCGFGDAQPNDNAAQALRGQTTAKTTSTTTITVAQSLTTSTTTAAAAKASASSNGAKTGAGTQFITGPCNRDLHSFPTRRSSGLGKCAGPIIAQERDGGCGFGDAQPNDNAAQALRGASKR